MSRRDELLNRVTGANPVPNDAELPTDVVNSRPPLGLLISNESAPSSMAGPQSLVRTSASGWRGPLIAVGTAFVILIVLAGSLLLIGRGGSGVVEGPATTVASTTLPPTTMPSTTVPPATVPSTTVPGEAVVPVPSPELPVLEVPLSEAVPGFSDTIVWSAVLEWSDNIAQAVFLLRSSESMAELLLPSEDDLALGDDLPFGGGALDASASWVADDAIVDVVPTVPGEPSRREIFRPVAQGAVVWHDTEPGHLAWLECPNSHASFLDGPTTLYTVDVSDPSADPTRVRSFDQGCRTGCWGVDEPCVTLVRWGRTGVWVTKYPVGWEARWFEETAGQDVIESVLVDADGAEIAMVSDALMIGMSPDGTSIWQSNNWQGPCFVLSPDGQQRSAVPGLDDGERLRGAWWSPDGTRLAMWVVARGLRTIDVVSGEVITEIAVPALDGYGASVAWSTDSRFLVYEENPRPGVDPAVLVIHDTATNTTTTVPISGDVGDIRVR